MIEILLTLTVLPLLAALLIAEWLTARRLPPAPGVGWKKIAARADTLIAGSMMLCLIMIWLPWLLR